MPASDYLDIPRGSAAHKRAASTTSTAAHSWELINGTVQIFISGPGPHAWYACSVPDYTPGPSGTVRERAIAKRALVICIQRHREDKDAGAVHIQDALALAKKQFHQANPKLELTPA